MAREETPSDDDEGTDNDFMFSNFSSFASEPLSMSGRVTPANGSVNGDEGAMSVWDSPMPMDLDAVRG